MQEYGSQTRARMNFSFGKQLLFIFPLQRSSNYSVKELFHSVRIKALNRAKLINFTLENSHRSCCLHSREIWCRNMVRKHWLEWISVLESNYFLFPPSTLFELQCKRTFSQRSWRTNNLRDPPGAANFRRPFCSRRASAVSAGLHRYRVNRVKENS